MKKAKLRILAIIMAVVLLAAVPALMGCSSSSDSAAAEMATDSYYSDYAPTYDYDVGYNSSADGSGSETETVAEESGSEAEQSEVERKIIRNADVSIDAEDANACYNAILTYAKQLGGYESNFNSRSNDYGGDLYVYIDLELRLPPEKLDEFISEIKNGEYGEVTNCSVTSDEVTEEYYDLETRLASKEKSLESYYALLEKAETIDDIMSIQYHIDSITEEIEAIKGRLRLYDSLVDESTVSISITQYTAAPIEEKEFEWNSLSAGDFFKLIKNGFLSVCNFVWSALLWIVIIVVSLLPILIIVGAVIFVVRKIRKKSESKAKVQNPPVVKGGDDVVSANKKAAEFDAPDYK